MRLFSLSVRTAALTALAAGTLAAQDKNKDTRDDERDRRDDADRQVTIYRPGDNGGVRFFSDDDRDAARRAVIGVTTSSGGERDTLGVLITNVTTGGPADRARLEEGNRIAAVNGVNLRLAAADAGEPDMQGLATRRLTRELAKVRPGDEVELRVWQNGRFQTVRVRTTAAESLPGRRPLLARGLSRAERDRQREQRLRERDERPVLGIELNPSGSRRDTLGVLVTRVTDGSPAERAGLVEGDRVASVNGVDLRVSRDDAGDDWVSGAKSGRFSREMQRARLGQPVELRVYSGGQYKTVRVTPARAADVYKEGRNNGFFSRSAWFDGDLMVPPLPPLPPSPAIAPLPPEPPLIDLRFDSEAISDRVNEAMRRAGDAIARSGEALRGVRVGGGRGIYWI
jgi:hypothetical protein